MALLLLHRKYERRCKACGYTWVVPRSLARQHPPTMPRHLVTDRWIPSADNLSDAVEAREEVFDAALEEYESLRRCPSCGVDEFTQRPARSKSGNSG